MIVLTRERIREAVESGGPPDGTPPTPGTAPTPTPGRSRESVIDRNSLDGRLELVRGQFHQQFRKGDGDMAYSGWISDVYPDHVVYTEGDDTFRRDYSIDGDGQVTFGEPTKVIADVTYRTLDSSGETATEADGETDAEVELTGKVTQGRIHETAETGILESLDDGAGWIWRVTLVRPGVSRNGRHYSRAVLREAVDLYEGTRAFDGHRVDKTVRLSSPIGGSNPLVGFYRNLGIRESDGALQADFHISKAAPGIRDQFVALSEADRPDLIGFSHDVTADTAPGVVDGRRVKDVRKIIEVHSVDVVANPSAGGRLERLVASRQDGEIMDPDELRALLDANPDLATAAREHLGDGASSASGGTATATATATDGDGEGGTVTESIREADGDRIASALVPIVASAAFERHGLPASARASLLEAFESEAVTSAATIDRRVRETAQIWQAAMAATPAQLPGQGARIEVGADGGDKVRHAMDALMMGVPEVEGVPAFRSIKEAYTTITGVHPYAVGDEDFNRRVLAESVGGVAPGASRLTESLTTASWTEVLGDSITRRLIGEYRGDRYSSWRQIVSDIVPINDFRTNRRTRIGGYDVLPTVAEAGPYTSLTSPTDEEASYAISKKGGTEDLTLEMIANDDLGGLRRIPTNLGRAAALTLYRAIWNTTIAGNAVVYDGTALFTVGHDNEHATTPLDEDGITTLRSAMIAQAALGESNGFIGLLPRFLVVPTALWVTAFKLTQSGTSVVGAAESATTPNPYQGLVPIEVPTLTDANDWYLIADPQTVPTIEVGFYQNRQDPELLVQDQPTVGSVFTNDVITWKIRHIWGLTVLDYRGFARATQV